MRRNHVAAQTSDHLVTPTGTSLALDIDSVELLEAVSAPVVLVDGRDATVVAANDAAVRLTRFDKIELVGLNFLDLAPSPEDECFWRGAAPSSNESIASRTAIRCKDGSVREVDRHARPLRHRARSSLYVVVLHDCSLQAQLERRLEGVVADLRATLESTHDGILVTDLHGKIRNFNRRFAQLWQAPQDLLERGDDAAVGDWMRRRVVDETADIEPLAAIDSADAQGLPEILTLVDGTVLERRVTPQRLLDRVVGRLYSFRDVTERLRADERIQALSYTDRLTGLPNRYLFADRVEAALAMSRREGVPFAVLLLNLDRFTHINDTLGRAFGDQVLLDVALRLKACLRQIDTVARTGSDEFVVLASRADASGAEQTVRRVLDALKQPFVHGDMSFTLTASVGVTLCPDDATTLDELLSQSAAAMREAKLAGRAGFRFHRKKADVVDEPARSRLRIDHEMRLALAQGSFHLRYQPQIDLAGGGVVGAEALIRWRHSELGDLSPAVFIPVAEESGFIISIGDWVLRSAIAQAARWVSAGRGVTVSINVSALQFQQPGFVDGVAQALQDARLAPHWIELELTESILVQDADEAMRRLESLALLGVKLAIDDFGTGYSSLAYLKKFPISRLKIDRTFIKGLPDEPSDVGIVRAIVDMGHALKMQTIAEGVETEGQRQFLQDAGCTAFQGFLFAPALDVAAFEAMIA